MTWHTRHLRLVLVAIVAIIAIAGANLLVPSVSAEDDVKTKVGFKADVLCVLGEICFDDVIQQIVEDPSRAVDAVKTVNPVSPVVVPYVPAYLDYVQDSVEHNVQPIVTVTKAYTGYVKKVGKSVVGFFK